MSGVQVGPNLKANKDGKFTDRLAASIGERLIALEKAVRGTHEPFVTPEIPAYGPGGPGATGPPGPPGTPGATDHGALTGLEDDDHPRYAQHEETMHPVPHQHNPGDLAGLDNEFLRRLERGPALPHLHHAGEVVGLDLESQTRTAHTHLTADVVDLRPDDADYILAARIYGG
jgi:hypothetical protein